MCPKIRAVNSYTLKWILPGSGLRSYERICAAKFVQCTHTEVEFLRTVKDEEGDQAFTAAQVLEMAL
jgi:hypothetical protein